MSTILGANTSDPAYEVSNSIRYNDDDAPELNRTPSSAGNRRTWTWSGWIKRGNITAFNVWGAGANVNDRIHFDFNTDGDFQSEAKISGSEVMKLSGTRQLRDVAAWYHLVWRVDTTQSTEANRVRIYVNGEQVTFTGSTNYPSKNLEMEMNNTSVHKIGVRSYADSNFFDGYMAEVYFADGQSYAPTTFAETNTEGIWVPKEAKDDITFGTNGYYLEFKQTGLSANSSGHGADTSGQDNHFNVNFDSDGRDITEDTPTNSFITMNPLATGSRATFQEGNTKVTLNLQGSVPYGQVEFGTFAVNTGKWYYEVFVVENGAGGQVAFGWNERWEDNNYYNGHNNLGSSGNVWYGDDGKFQDGSTANTTAPNTYADSDIIGIAIDIDNKKFYAHKNGTYQSNGTGTGDPSNGTNGFSFTSHYNDYWTPWISKDDTSSSNNPTANFNFGTGINIPSSSNSDANGYGRFEYAVPTGFFALNTKNLAEYG